VEERIRRIAVHQCQHGGIDVDRTCLSVRNHPQRNSRRDRRLLHCFRPSFIQLLAPRLHPSQVDWYLVLKKRPTAELMQVVTFFPARHLSLIA
jgi:hypothetical protein